MNITLVNFWIAEYLPRTAPQLLSIDVNYIAHFKEPHHQVASCSSASCCVSCLGVCEETGDKLQPFGLNFPKTSSQAQAVEIDVAASARPGSGSAHARAGGEKGHGGDTWCHRKREDNGALAWWKPGW